MRVGDVPGAIARFTRCGKGFNKPLTHAFAGHLHQTERGHFGNLMAGAIAPEALNEAPQHQLTVGLQHHIDEVHHDDSADVA